MKKTDLIKICEELENCSHILCQKNEIVCAKSKLQEYIKNDKNNYLKLKAQIKLYHSKTINPFDFITKIVTISTFCLTIILNLFRKQNPLVYAQYAFLYLIIIAFICILSAFYYPKDKRMDLWVNYIEIALEDIQNDFT